VVDLSLFALKPTETQDEALGSVTIMLKSRKGSVFVREQLLIVRSCPASLRLWHGCEVIQCLDRSLPRISTFFCEVIYCSSLANTSVRQRIDIFVRSQLLTGVPAGFCREWDNLVNGKPPHLGGNSDGLSKAIPENAGEVGIENRENGFVEAKISLEETTQDG
jgi:hypothetical protein